MKGRQAYLFAGDTRVVKTYKSNYVKNKLSSVEKEIEVWGAFNSRHCPVIYDVFNNGYIMEKYNYALGGTKDINMDRVKQTPLDLIKELNSIERDLKKYKIIHRDINPGNLLYSSKEKCLKLIDFYWAVFEGEKLIDIPKLNKYYGNDKEAFEKLRKQVKWAKS
ncbi:MAG: hypothetical protein GY853_13765 [PVC group bacterium]|nr:hypothetical protein [PVC group bacterium]